MSERPSGHEATRRRPAPATGAGHAGAGPRTYLVVAAFLLAITVMEVWIFYVPALARVLVPILLILSTLKFALVAMFYMHLRFDHAVVLVRVRRPPHHRHRPRRRAPLALRPHRHHGRVPGGRGVTGDDRLPLAPRGRRSAWRRILVGYLLATGVLRRRFAWGPPPSRGRVTAFVAGTAILAGAVLGPLAEWAEHVALSAHMAQHLLLILVVPLLWLLGLPPWLLAPVARAPVVGRLGWWLTRPLPALALASAVQVAWHVPAAFDAALRVDRLPRPRARHVPGHRAPPVVAGRGTGARVAAAEPARPAPLSLPGHDPHDGDRRAHHAGRRTCSTPSTPRPARPGPSRPGRIRSSRES